MISIAKDNPLLILDQSQNSSSSLRTILTDINIPYLTFAAEIEIFNYLQNITYIPIIFVFNFQQLSNINNYLKSPSNRFIDCKIPLIFIDKNNSIKNRKNAFKLGAIESLNIPLMREEIEIKLENWLKIANNYSSFYLQNNYSLTKKNNSLTFQLKKCQGLFDNTLSLIKGWIWETNLEGIFTYVSPKIEQYLGLKPEVLIGKSVFELVNDSEREEISIFWESLLKNPRFFHRVKKYHLLPLNQDIWLESRGIPIFDSKGKLQGYRGLEENITAQKQAEISLTESEIRYRLLTEIIPVGIYQIDKQGNTIYTNHLTQQLSGIEAEKNTGKEWMKNIHPDDKEYLINSWYEALHQQKPFQAESRFLHPDGKVVWILGQSVPYFSSDGEFQGHIGALTDITSFREMKIALTESKELYQITFEKANLGIAHVSISGQCLKVNQKMTEMFGYTKEEIVTKTWMEMTHPDDLEPSVAFVEQLLAGEIENYSMTKRYFRQDGSIFWGLVNVSLHRDQAGKPVYFIATVQNITDRILAEQKVKESQQRLEIITETINDVFWMTNWHTQVSIHLSKAFEDIWQYSREAIYQDHNLWLNSIHPGDRTRVREAFAEVVNKGIYHEEYRIVRPDGEIRWIEDKGYPIVDDLNKEIIVVGCARDISEMKSAQWALAESEALHRMILNNISDTVLLTDREGNFTFICPNVHFIFEYTWDEVKTMGNIKYILGENFYDTQELEAKQEINNIEIIAIDKLNREHNLLVNIKLFTEKQGIILYSARDITEKKQAEKETLTLQTRNENLVESLGEIVYEHDVINHIVHWDGAYEELLGYSKEEMKEEESFWLNNVHPEDLASVENELKKNNNIPEDFFFTEYRFQAKNGDYLWFLDRGIMEYNSRGENIKVTGIMLDVSDRKRIELAIRHIAKAITLKSEENFLQSLVKYLAEILPADVVFLSEIHPDTVDYATTLVCYHHGEFQPNFSYQIKNTPCEQVLYQDNPSFCLYSNNILSQYPHSLLLQTIDAQTYMGMALFNSNKKPIGCLVALSGNFILDTAINREIFQIFTSTAAAELERRKIRIQLEEFNQQLETKVKKRTLELQEAKENAEEKAIALRYLNEIERLLSDISTSLFMIEAEKVDDYINDALTAIALFLKVEQITIFEFDKGEETFSLSHQSQSSIIDTDLSDWHISTRLISWLVSQLQTKWIVMINSADDFPTVAQTEKQLFEQLNLKSFVALPIEFSSQVVGFLTAVSINHRHEWNQGETNLLQLTGKLFSNAIARKKSETALKQTQEALSATNEILTEEVREREVLYNKLQQSETRYRTLFESSHDALSLIDVETETYIDGNEAALRIHDCITRREFLGKHPSDFAPEYQATGELSTILASQYIHEAFTTGGSFFEWNVNKKDGTIIPCLVSLSAIPNQKQKIVLAISRDISEIKQVQVELEQAKEEADSANKAKSEFLASMSHEIRTPMNAILGFTHIALQNEPDNKQKDYLLKIQKACESLLLIINDILDFSKIEAGKLDLETHNFLLDNVLTDVANLLNPKTQEKGLELIFDVDNQLDYSLWGDSLRLSQILINLINNAVKFTEKGQIVIRIRCQKIDNQVISSPLNPPLIRGEGEKPSEDNLSEYVTLSFCVKDTGIGISKKKLSQLFQPFSQADGSITRKYGGTGLGLVISRRLIEMMDGKIWAESEENKGSKFHFTIKLRKGDRTSNLIPRSLSYLTSNPILVVDDNSITRKVIARFLESFSFAVKTVKSGLEAIKELEKAENDYKLIILDWQMPNLNGIETMKAMKANPNIRQIPPILMITAHHISELEEFSQKHELKYFLNKPITKSSLFNAILSVFSGKSSLIDTSPVAINIYPNFQCFKDCRLLLVEDNDINQEIAIELLKGVNIDIANNGLEAIEKINSQDYDAVLMDISMPEIDGLEATKRIRQLEGEYFQKVPIIAMTAHAMTGDRELSLNAGMNDHIIKPINPRQLKKTLLQWLPEDKIVSDTNNPPSLPANENPEEIIPSLQGINSEAALSRLMGNRELYLRLLKQFVKSHSHKKALITSAIEKEDYSQAREITHSVKGVAGNIGAENLFDTAQELESALKQEDTDNIPTLAENFYQSFYQVINSLQQLETDFVSSSVKERENQKIDYVQIKELLIEIIELLEIDLTEANVKLNQLELIGKNSEIGGKIEEIRNCYDNFELEKVTENLNKLMKEYE